MGMTWEQGSGAAVADTASSSLAAEVREQVPGWTIASASSVSSAADALSADGDSQEAQPGPDIEALRRKFLDSDAAGDAAAPVFARGEQRKAAEVELFRIEPTEGGPSQVAERRNGKIRIVSG